MTRNRDVAAKALQALIMVLVLGGLEHSQAWAATEWNTNEYDLYPGDFNGDGKTDLLYLAKDVARASGIAVSDGTGPNIPWQSWPSSFLGIPWSGSTTNAIVADFSGDGRSDILLQRKTPGDHYLLIANEQGKFVGVQQTIGNNHLQRTWSAAEHVIVAGDFDGDGRADVLMQATQRSGSGVNATNYIVLADQNDELTIPGEHWGNGYLGFKWSTAEAIIHAGNFNGVDGDGKRRADLLIQAKPSFVMIDFDPAFPVPAHAPNMNGIVLAGTGSSIFSLAGVHAWSRRDYGADWSPLTSTLVIGDFNGDGRDDVLIQPRSAVQPAKLATGSGSGNPITSATTLADNVSWAASSYRLIAGNFDGGEGAGVYFQATAPAGTNSIADVVTSAFITLSAHNPSSASGTLPVSAVGRTSGSFRVYNDGAATYTIPIVVPPGVMGIQPELSIAYDSSKSGGAIGLGWNLLGFSRITRCGKTIDQDGTVSAVELSMNDRFCLDGNKLRLTEGAYGAAGSKYRTEFETFAVITAVGTAGSGPASFTMVAKNGTTYEYGATANSRIESIKPASSTTPHTWAVNKIKDVHGNYMTFTYQEDGAPNGSFRPISITYTSNDAVPLTAAYSVNFIWDPRPEFDLSEAYVGGGRIRDTFRLARIETRYGGSLVRSYRVWHYSERPSS